MKVHCKKLKSESKHKMSQKNLSKKVAYKTRSRNQTDNELEKFAKVLSSDENALAVSLEKLALKKSAHSEVFSQIKIAFGNSDFILKNEELHFKQKDGKILEYSILVQAKIN